MDNELEKILNFAGIEIPATTSERLCNMLELNSNILMLEGQIELCDRLMKFKEERGEEITDKMEQNQERLKETLRGFKNDLRIKSDGFNKHIQTEL